MVAYAVNCFKYDMGLGMAKYSVGVSVTVAVAEAVPDPGNGTTKPSSGVCDAENDGTKPFAVLAMIEASARAEDTCRHSSQKYSTQSDMIYQQKRTMAHRNWAATQYLTW